MSLRDKDVILTRISFVSMNVSPPDKVEIVISQTKETSPTNFSNSRNMPAFLKLIVRFQI